MLRQRMGAIPPAGPLPADWKADIVKRLATAPTKAAEPAKPGSFEAFVAGRARRLNKPELSDAETLSARRVWEDAGRAPKEPKTDEDATALAQAVLTNPAIFGDLPLSSKSRIAVALQKAGFAGFGGGGADRGVSADNKAAAATWRYDKLEEIDERGLGETEEDEAAAKKARQAVEDVYRVVISGKGWEGLGPRGDVVLRPEQAAPRATLPPTSTASPAASRAATGAIPQWATDAFKDVTVPAGQQGVQKTFSDGSVYIKLPDGTIRRGS